MELLPMEPSLAIIGLAVKLVELLLIGAGLSLLGLAAAFVALAAATSTEERPFTRRVIIPAAAPHRIPTEELLLQIESHVRLERAAAESFLKSPSPALLRASAISPLAS